MESFQALWSAEIRKSCESCQVAKATVFCRPDSAFLCLSCDAEIHGANKVASRYHREWMCVVCEQGPAAVVCNPDAAALCATCDADLHSPGTRASRHVRVPVMPYLGWEPFSSSSIGPGHERGGGPNSGDSSGSELVEGSDFMSVDELSTYVDSFLVFDRDPSPSRVRQGSDHRSEPPPLVSTNQSWDNLSGNEFCGSFQHTTTTAQSLSQHNQSHIFKRKKNGGT
ncbi:B-box-type zinc finger [Trema orientale]|uniref:B-box-type zinc finger n=1 Tax=Trema orientale TaxID=63057 RepID=A0A2P5FJM8_TREOI|nr:B-box-type zinc finger [Trema orientale]